MARPKKARFICSKPQSLSFVSLYKNQNDEHVSLDNRYENIVEKIFLTYDEYETIRIIDYLGFNQIQCAEHMNVARTTVQAIYENARKKLADFIVNNKILVIGGGNCQICDGINKRKLICNKSNCQKNNKLRNE